MAEEESDAVLSDVDEDPALVVLPSSGENAVFNQRLRDLQSELDRERQDRKSAEDAHLDLQNKFARLKVLAQEAIRKRDEAVRSSETAKSELAEAFRIKDEAIKQKDALKSEIESSAQMLASGIDKVSGKVGRLMNFSMAGLPRSQKFATGLPSVAYGVIKRSDEIVEELVHQLDSAVKERNEAREQVEQRNYEIAIEISQLEATMSNLREEVKQKSSEIDDLEKMVSEKDARIKDLEEFEAKWRDLQERVNSQRSVVMELLKNISLAQEQISEIIENAGLNEWISSDFSESQFIFKELEIEENLQTLLEGTGSVCELVKVAAEKLRARLAERREEVDKLRQEVTLLLGEKSHIGSLLRSALSSKMGEMRKGAENGHVEGDGDKEDEVYKLAGVLEDTVKASQMEIIELQHQVEALGAECSLLKAQLSAHAKEIGQQKLRIKELEEKERQANENVEGLMMDISAAEEDIARWKVAAEQEAAAGRAIEQEFEAKVSSIRVELEDAKQAVSELESKLKVKEETSTAAIAARDAAEKSLRLADMRSARLRERLEELTRQLSESDISEETRNHQRQRYICWPWQWLGLTIVRDPAQSQETSNEMELSEPLI
ncbi:paramyosin [Wolffia australiana]